MNTPEIIQSAIASLAAVGLFLNLLHLKTARRRKSAEFFLGFTQQYSTDSDILDARYLIEYNRFEFDERFSGSRIEKSVDKLLAYYDTVSRLVLMKQLKIEDLKSLAYGILVVYQNDEIKRYFDFLDDWYSRRGLATKPFESFRKIAEEVKARFYTKKKEVKT